MLSDVFLGSQWKIPENRSTLRSMLMRFFLTFLFVLAVRMGLAVTPAFLGIPVDQFPAAKTDALQEQSCYLSPLLPAALDESKVSGEPVSGYFANRGLRMAGVIGKQGALVTVEDAAVAKSAGGQLLSIPVEWKFTGDPEALSGEESHPFHVYHTGDGKALRDLLAKDFPAVETSFGQSTPSVRWVGIRVDGQIVKQLLKELSSQPQVFHIQRAGGAKLLNTTARRIVMTGSTATGAEAIFWDNGLRGEGEIIAFVDSGLDPLNCFFREGDASLPPTYELGDTGPSDLGRRKIVAYDFLYSGDRIDQGLPAYENQGHGTSVAGCAAGSDLDNPFADGEEKTGVAPAAKIIMQDGGFTQFDDCSEMVGLGCPVRDMTEVLEQAFDQGARIHNNSWGDRENFPDQNEYSAVTADFDEMVWRNPDFLIVCAAGNSGGNGNDSVGSPSVGKNVLAVGGTENPGLDSRIFFSSLGWATDGRIKPDVMAPASAATANWNPAGMAACFTRSAQGTSFSSPFTAGAAALMRQAIREGRTPGIETNIPSAALIKALMINGAVPMANEPAIPSRQQGWGRLDTANALGLEGFSVIAVDEREYFQSSGNDPYELRIKTAAAAQLDVTLVYTDYPGLPGSNPSLVNDLDLELHNDGELLFYANNFNQGQSAAGGASDPINNVERIRFQADADIYTIVVRPSAIIQPGQGFALAVKGQLADSAASAWIVR